MEAQLKNLHSWFIARAPRERIMLLLLSLGAVLILWYYLLANSLWQKLDTLANSITNAKQQLEITRLQIHTYKSSDNNPQLLAEHKQLLQRITQLNQELSKNKQPLITAKENPTVLKAILDAAQELSLTQLDNLPAVKVNKFVVPPNNPIYQHGLSLQFNGNYLATIQFLQKLEAMPWRFYWEKLDYKVTDYPAAHITLQLHTLSPEKEFANG